MGGGSMPTPPPPPDNTPVLLEQMRQNREESARARRETDLSQRNAMIEAQNQQASMLAREGSQRAQQSISGMNALKAAEDAAARQRSLLAAQGAGAAATGTGYDINTARQGAMANLGAASGTLPSTGANVMNPTMVNPAMTTAANLGAGGGSQRVNQFAVPSASGLTFGGV
jgi:type IV secretory pathway VirB10-like protein